MRKIWKYTILFAVLGALLCMSVFAADAEPPTVINFVEDAVEVNPGNVSFNATYNGGEAAKNKQYLILMMKGDATETAPSKIADPTEKNILYVNQTAADSTGTVTFDTVYPMDMEDGVIWLAGGGSDPVALASVKAPKPEGVTVSGAAVSWNDNDDAVYLLYGSTVDDAAIKAEWAAGSCEALYTGTKGSITGATVDGKAMKSQTFTFEGVADGSYKLAILKPGKYVPKIVAVTVSGSAVDMGQQKLWLYGDVNYDGKIRTADATQVLQYIAKKRTFTAEELAAADITGDGNIRTGDATQIKRYIAKKSSDFDDMK